MEDESRWMIFHWYRQVQEFHRGNMEGSPARRTAEINFKKIIQPPVRKRHVRVAIVALYIILISLIPLVAFIAFVRHFFADSI